MNRRHALATATGSLLAGLPFASRSQEASVLRLIVGFPAGGAPDAVARAYAEQLRQATGAQVVVENRAGAGGKIGIDALLGAPADGRTLSVIPTSVLALMPQVVRSFRYDAVNDFVPVAALAEYGFALGVGSGAPNGSLGAFLAWARLNPGRVSYATPGLGTPQHFLGASLAKAANVELTHLPYKGGALAMNDVLGGQVPALITTEPLLVPQHGGGRLRTLLVTSPRRHPGMPDAPTARESGFPQLETTDWFGLFAARGTSEPLVQALRATALKVVNRPEYVRTVADLGYTASDPRDTRLRQRMERDVTTWTARVKASGFTSSD